MNQAIRDQADQMPLLGPLTHVDGPVAQSSSGLDIGHEPLNGVLQRCYRNREQCGGEQLVHNSVHVSLVKDVTVPGTRRKLCRRVPFVGSPRYT